MGLVLVQKIIRIIAMEKCLMSAMSKKCRLAVVIVLSAYIIKNLLVGADSDEGYGIVLGYRLAMGDRLLLEMWEPHQTSAIFTFLFIGPFLRLTGGTGFLNIYLRMIYFLIQGVISYFVYRTFRTCIFNGEKRDALWLALVFFVLSPKCIYIPEYSNLHIWFFTLLCLSVLWYSSVESPLKGRRWLLGAAGLALACDVLAYPSMAILFPVFFVYIWSKADKKTDCVIFTAPCMFGGALFFSYLVSYMTFDQVVQVIPRILSDGTHKVDFFQKVLNWFISFGEIILILFFTGIAAMVLTVAHCRIKREKSSKMAHFLVYFFLVQVAYQFYCWFTSEFKASYPLVIYSFILLSGVFCYKKDKLTSSTEKPKDEICLYLIFITLVNYFGVMLMSNWEPIHLMPYLILGVLGGLRYLGGYVSKHIPSWKDKALPVLCGILVFSNVFGYCWLYIGGEWNHNSILTLGGVNREGVRGGILTSYMSAYRYNSNEEVWTEAVPAGSTCLYVGVDQYYYMFGDCKIAAASTISTPVYDENLLAYWELNPDRYPDVVVVESWFGDMRAAPEDSFIRQWLEKEFHASRVAEYSYVAVYYK